MNSLNSLVLFAFLLTPVFCYEIGYDCASGDNNRTIISLLNAQTCMDSGKNLTRSEAFIQVIQPKLKRHISFFKCSIIKTTKAFRCGRMYQQFVPGAMTSVVVIPRRTACENLIDNKDYITSEISAEQLIQDRKNYVRRVTRGTFSGDGDCSPGEPTTIAGVYIDRPVVEDTYEIFFTSGRAVYDGKTDKIILPSGSYPYSPMTCNTVEGTYFWSKDEDPICRDSSYEVIYEGLANLTKTPYGEFYSHQGKVSFYLEKREQQAICSYPSWTTDLPSILVLEKTPTPFPLTVKGHTVSDLNLDLITFIESKFKEMTRRVDDAFLDLQVFLAESQCLAKKTQLEIQLAAARRDPQEFAYQFMGSPGFSAVVLGEVIYITSCKLVPVTYRQVDKCYQELPVNYSGRPAFLTPKFRTIQYFGTELDCFSPFKSLFKLGKEWYGVDSTGLHEVKDPITVDPNKGQKWRYDIMASKIAGLYDQDQLDEMRAALFSPGRVESLSSNLINRVYTGDKMQLSNGFTIEDFQKIQDQVGVSWIGFIKRTLGEFGNWVSVVLGIVVAWKAVCYFINVLLNGKLLYEVFGVSWKVLAAISEGFASFFLHKEGIKKSEGYNLKKDLPEHMEFIPIGED
jgi:hypothetical protein